MFLLFIKFKKNMYKKILILLFLFTAGFGLTYKLIPIKDEVFPGGTLEYKLELANNETKEISVYLNKFIIENTFKKAVSIEPSINIKISPKETKEINITIPVAKDVNVGTYQTPLIISYDGITKKIFIESTILSKYSLPINIKDLDVILPEKIIPLYPFNATITLFSNIDQLGATLHIVVSNDEVIYDSSKLVILKKGINLIEKEVKLPYFAQGKYNFLVEVIVGKEVLNQKSKYIYIDKYKHYTTYTNITTTFLGKEIKKVINNTGTDKVNVLVNYTLNTLDNLLTQTREIEIYKNGVLERITKEDNITLMPGEYAILIIKINYTILIVIPFLILLTIIAWFYLTKKVVINKEIIECVEEDGELTIKVAISAKNVSLHSIYDVKIIEDLPLYARKAGAFGSIKGKIDKEKGTITFDIGRLDPKEEILLSYKFKTDVELEGRISLPPATIKFKEKGKTKIVKSNTPIVHLIRGGA